MPSPVALALDGDPAGAAAAALRTDDPDDRYLDLVLVAVACKRLGDLEAVALTARAAAHHYRPIVEEGLYPLYASYLQEIASALPDAEIAPFVRAMEPEIQAVGALPPSGDPPSRFLSLYAELLRLSEGGDLPLDYLRRHEAAHLLLIDLARRCGPAPSLDEAILDLGLRSAREAEDLSRRAARSPDLYTRGRLRHALLRIANSTRSLLERAPDLACPLAEAIPWTALAQLPRGPRLEAIGALVEAIADYPPAMKAILYPAVVEAIAGADSSDSWRRRLLAPLASLAAAFADASEDARVRTLELLDRFMADPDPLAEGDPEQAGRTFARALGLLGERGLGAFEPLHRWCAREAIEACPAVIARWARASGRSPFEVEPAWTSDPVRAWAVVREAEGSERQAWAAEVLATPSWDLRALALDRQGVPGQRALAELLVQYPQPLADVSLAGAIAGFVRDPVPGLGHPASNPFARTLDLLGPEVPPYPLAVLFDARVASEGYAAYEHDQALRLVAAWALQDGPNAALRLAAGFGSRNDASWLLGPLLADGAAPHLDPDIVSRLALNPFLYGAYLLESRCAS